MRWSQTWIPTLREDPADAEAVSHRLLVRAGFIRQLMAGHYALLPLAVRVRAKIIGVVREEMDRIGGQELLLPAMHPAELWRRSGRWEVMGEELFRVRDRKGAELVLGMTHEEVVTTLALELRSYRDLPQVWYQLSTKFRDEPRPRGGLVRVREFTMKDSYSFDLDAAGLDRAFDRHREAYTRAFERLGVPAIPVQASSGQMGGSASVEFACPSEAGEDLVVRCPACGYAANVEKATSALSAAQDGPGLPAPERFATPGARTIEDLARDYQAPADRQAKTLVYVVDGRPTLVLLRGDHSLVEQKLFDATGAGEVRPARPDEIRDALGASAGSLGAVGLDHLPVVADEALRGRRDLVTGANLDDVHLRGVDVDRDIRVARWADLREVGAGEPCPACRGPLRSLRAIEVGHIFKLGSRYAEAFGLSVLGPDGEPVTPVMGCYGIGVERAMAAIVESHHDDAGIVWPLQVAPFVVAVVALNPADPEVARAAAEIRDRLEAGGVDVLVDDRDERPGVKFRDAELIGFPFRVTVGARDLAEGRVELVRRDTGERRAVAVDAVADRVLELAGPAAGRG
jgi:prolyl-tRNA synthetase family II